VGAQGVAAAPPAPIRAVFLDAGNTLVGLDYAAIAARIRADGHAVDLDRLRTAEARARVRLDPHVAARGSTEALDTFAWYVRYVLDELGVAWSAAGQRIATDLRAADPPLWSVPLPEAPGALEALRGLGLRLAVVSNSNGTVAGLLERLGLARWLDAVVDSGVVGVEKPDPRIFRHAAEAIGVRPEEAVHVGDLYSVDVLGARAAGAQAILLDPVGAWPVDDCPKAPDVAGAAALIARMAARAV
jgi:HAD superfamily hydrolase (TIGR01509 family)